MRGEKRSRMIAPESVPQFVSNFCSLARLCCFHCSVQAMFSLAQYLHSKFEASKPVLDVLFVNGEERCAVAGWLEFGIAQNA
jgi:hypothetical protein